MCCLGMEQELWCWKQRKMLSIFRPLIPLERWGCPYLHKPEPAGICGKRHQSFCHIYADGWKRSVQIRSFQSAGSDFEVLEKQENKRRDSLYMLHQANQRIVSSVAKHMKEPLEKYPMNIERLGNTSSASIPLLLDEWKKEEN